jgi:hypothetical protein
MAAFGSKDFFDGGKNYRPGIGFNLRKRPAETPYLGQFKDIIYGIIQWYGYMTLGGKQEAHSKKQGK